MDRLALVDCGPSVQLVVLVLLARGLATSPVQWEP
jgi:hypothetical protein